MEATHRPTQSAILPVENVDVSLPPLPSCNLSDSIQDHRQRAKSYSPHVSSHRFHGSPWFIFFNFDNPHSQPRFGGSSKPVFGFANRFVFERFFRVREQVHQSCTFHLRPTHTQYKVTISPTLLQTSLPLA